MIEHPFIMDQAEQLDVSPVQAAQLQDAGLIYNPVEGEPWYFTTMPDFTLDDCEKYLTGIREDKKKPIVVQVRPGQVGVIRYKEDA